MLSNNKPSIVAAAIIAAMVFDANAADLPTIPDIPAVTPGGALPFRDELPRLPRDRGPGLSAPEEERPAVPDSGIRMNVSGFVLEGIVDRPERGIAREDLERRVEAIRVEHPRGFTISELQKVTDEITRVYRSAGYILMRAYIPEQRVTDGRVTIRILEGELEKLVFEGNQSYSDEVLAAPFEGLVGQPVNREEIQSALLTMGDYPGLTFNSVFSPGDTMGTAQLGLNIEQEKGFEGTLWLDNYGSTHTGEYRLWVDAAYNNVSGAGDRLTGRVLKTMGDGEGSNTYYGFGYQRPVFGPRNLLSFDISTNAFQGGGALADLNLQGESSMMSTALRRSFVRSRDMNIEGRFGLSLKESSSSIYSLDLGTDKITVLTLGGAADFRGGSGYTQTALQYSQGLAGALGAMDEEGDGNPSRTGGSGEPAGGDFGKLNLQLTRWQWFPSVPLLRNQTLLARVEAQESSDLLVSMEQMSLGGPTSVRAYPPSEYMVDSGHFVSLEWIARSGNAVEGELLNGLQVSVFYDYAAGELNDPRANDIKSPDIQGYGLSVQVAPKKEYIARLEVATPAKEPDPSNDRDPQYFFKLGYLF